MRPHRVTHVPESHTSDRLGQTLHGIRWLRQSPSPHRRHQGQPVLLPALMHPPNFQQPEPLVPDQSELRVITTLVRPGSGRPIDSKVFRPITTGFPIVTCLKYFKSDGRCHGSWLSTPMMPLSARATINAVRIIWPPVL